MSTFDVPAGEFDNRRAFARRARAGRGCDGSHAEMKTKKQ